MRTNFPVEYISPLDTPIPINVDTNERIIRYKNMYIFADRAQYVHGRVVAPVAGSMSYNSGLGYFLQNPVFDAIGSWASSAWNWITGQPNLSPSDLGTVPMSNGNEFVVAPDDPNIVQQADGSYWYNTGSELQPITINPSYEPPVASSALTTPGLNVPAYNQLFDTAGYAGNASQTTIPATITPVIPKAQPITQATQQPQASWNIPNISYNPSSGAWSVGNTPSPVQAPGNVATPTPGTMDIFTQVTQQAAGAVLPILPWVLAAIAAAIVVPPVVRSFSGRGA